MNLDQSARNPADSKQSDQGEIRIKFTDSAKALPSENVLPLYRYPGSGRTEQIEIKVNFAMAYGVTQNFSQPIYSGIFAYRCTFNGKPNPSMNAGEATKMPEEVQLHILQNNCILDQTTKNGRNAKVVMNLQTIIEKAIKLQIKKINLRQDNFFKLEGQIKNIFHTKESNQAMLRLRIQDTHAHQSTQQARGHFAEFGISSSQNNHTGMGKQHRPAEGVSAYPNQNLDRIPFPETIFITFTRPLKVWQAEDLNFIRKIDEKITEMQKTTQMPNMGKHGHPEKFFEITRKITEMTEAKKKVMQFQDRQMETRTMGFAESGQLCTFLINYDMKIDKCLKAMSMDRNCTSACSEKSISEFGQCGADCGKRAQRMLSHAERMCILYSMIYVEKGDTEPDVREHLWMRASGAHQLMKSYQGYSSMNSQGQLSSQKPKDYFTALEESPNPPNTSVGTIKADQTRIKFDLDVLKKTNNYKNTYRELKIEDRKLQQLMQKRFASLMTTYHKRNGASTYNQSQSEIVIRLLEVVFKKETAFWLYCVLNESILPLNFYTNTLYPQAFLEYTIKLVKQDDKGFFDKSGDAINMFCLKSYYSLFTNLSIDKDENSSIQKSEMAYLMLDLIFLLGDPKQSTTLLDDPIQDGHFNVGEVIPQLDRLNSKSKSANRGEERVRIDRTSQLLISMSITVAERVKMTYLRDYLKEKKEARDEQIKSLAGFEEIVRTYVNDKSTMLTNLLNIEIFFFSKRNNESVQREQTLELISLSNRIKKNEIEDQADKWLRNNEEFGLSIDKIKAYTDKRFDRRPRIKTNHEDGKRYLDKGKFLSKFSCFSGYMQYVDQVWNEPCHGINYHEFKESLVEDVSKQNRQTVRSNFYNNYKIEEKLVEQVECGGKHEQPVCIYDFSVKNFAHDNLSFSTRHQDRDTKPRFIDEDYFSSNCVENSYNVPSVETEMTLPFPLSRTLDTDYAGNKAMDEDVDDLGPALRMTAVVEESKNELRHNLTNLGNHTSSNTVVMSREEYRNVLNQPFLLEQKVIPAFLPIYRGIHICTENFKRAFKECYKQDSSVLARVVLNDLEENNKPADLKLSSDGQDAQSGNMLFSASMFELLYARDVFNSAVRTEGSFTNARAMAQLRQYYVRMLDLNDSLGLIRLWNDQLNTYIQELTRDALNRDVTVNQRAAAGVEKVPEADNEVLRRLIRHHSDLTFLHQTMDLKCKRVTLYQEKSKKFSKVAEHHLKSTTYRHLMIEDRVESLPLTEHNAGLEMNLAKLNQVNTDFMEDYLKKENELEAMMMEPQESLSKTENIPGIANENPDEKEGDQKEVREDADVEEKKDFIDMCAEKATASAVADEKQELERILDSNILSQSARQVEKKGMWPKDDEGEEVEESKSQVRPAAPFRPTMEGFEELSGSGSSESDTQTRTAPGRLAFSQKRPSAVVEQLPEQLSKIGEEGAIAAAAASNVEDASSPSETNNSTAGHSIYRQRF